MKPNIVSQLKRGDPTFHTVTRFVHSRIKNPDKGSQFDRKTRMIRWLPKKPLIGLMKRMGYDGIVLTDQGKVAASIFFQRHGHTLHSFAVRVEPEYQGTGKLEEMVVHLINYARRASGIRYIRFSLGGELDPTRAYGETEKIADYENALGIKLLKPGLIEIVPRGESSGGSRQL